ncbi:MAG TPA: hypothetical protein VHX99_02950 [Rhizomicrobium sp.]|jgi:hypothetical protein|nr:hypothetical protein [Rhizomicrobium sp.]
MAKSSPEKLAEALRANLKRRKQTGSAKPIEPPQQPAPEPLKKPPKTPTRT